MSVSRFMGHGSITLLILVTSGLGCSDPVSPTPQGAFNVTFGDAIGTGIACPAKNPAQLQVGSVGSAQSAPVSDGEDGATVTCSVTKTSAGFRVSGSIVKGTAQLYLAPVDVAQGSTSNGRVAVSGANTAGKSYGPATGTSCEFGVIEVTESRAWLSFDCPHVVSGSSESEQCSIYNGFLLLDNCES